MEKEKPYKCDVCGKRYKNLNGLKYHKTHSMPCNPELRNQPMAGRPAQATPGLANMMANGQPQHPHMGMGAGLSAEGARA